jgi:hypothetical protein
VKKEFQSKVLQTTLQLTLVNLGNMLFVESTFRNDHEEESKDQGKSRTKNDINIRNKTPKEFKEDPIV